MMFEKVKKAKDFNMQTTQSIEYTPYTASEIIDLDYEKTDIPFYYRTHIPKSNICLIWAFYYVDSKGNFHISSDWNGDVIIIPQSHVYLVL